MRDDPAQRLTIGMFATLTQLSVRTLRRYHEAGLLEPRTVDPFTAYRYHDAGPIAVAQVIHSLREPDVPRAGVQSMIGTDDPGRRADLAEGHLKCDRAHAEGDRFATPPARPRPRPIRRPHRGPSRRARSRASARWSRCAA